MYLNLRDREPEGIVRPGDHAQAVLAKLQEGLGALRDPETGEAVVRTVYLGQDLYEGPRAAEAADVVVGFHPGYRISWQTALGGTPQDVIEPNPKKWCGDHCSLDPAVTPGVLFCNRRLKAGTDKARRLGGGAFPSLLDIAPSLAALFGVKPQAEGESLWA